MSARFAPGELVDLTIKGARVGESTGKHWQFLTGGGDLFIAAELLLSVEISRVAPAEWPPQSGDVWEDASGVAWFTSPRHPGTTPWMIGGDDADHAGNLLRDRGPMTLVYRKGWTPAPAAEAKPAEVDKRTATIAGLRALADLIEAQPTLPTPYVQANIYIEHLFKDPDERHAELERIARVLDVEPDSRDKETWPGQRHRYARKALGGGVSYEAVICGVYPEPESTTDVPPSSPEEVAGPGVAAAGPATAPSFELGPVPDGDGDLIAAVEEHNGPAAACLTAAKHGGGECSDGGDYELVYRDSDTGEVLIRSRICRRHGENAVERRRSENHSTRTDLEPIAVRAVEQDPDALDQLGVAATDPGEASD